MLSQKVKTLWRCPKNLTGAVSVLRNEQLNVDEYNVEYLELGGPRLHSG